MMETLKRAWSALNDRRTPVGKSFRTFYQVFIPLFGTSLLGFFGQVQKWASCISDCEPFPSPDPLGKALVAAFAAGMGALVTYFMNAREDRAAAREVLDAEPLGGGDTSAMEVRTQEGEASGHLTLHDE